MLEAARRRREAEESARAGMSGAAVNIDAVAQREEEAGDSDDDALLAYGAVASAEAGSAEDLFDLDSLDGAFPRGADSLDGGEELGLAEYWRDLPPLRPELPFEERKERAPALFHTKRDYGLTWATDPEDVALSDTEWAEKWFSNPIMHTQPPGTALAPDGTELSREGYYAFNLDDAEFLVRQLEDGRFDLSDVWVQAEAMTKRDHVIDKDISYERWAAAQRVPYERARYEEDEEDGAEGATEAPPPQLYSVMRFEMTEARDFDIQQWHEDYPERVPFMDTIIRSKLEQVFLVPVKTDIPIGPRCEFKPPTELLGIDTTMEERVEESDWWLPPMFEFTPQHNELYCLDSATRTIRKVHVAGPHASELEEPALMFRDGDWRVLEARHLPTFQRVTQEESWKDACDERAAYEQKRLSSEDVDESIFDNMTTDALDLGESDAPEVDLS